MNNIVRTLIVIYIILFVILCVFITPYKQYTYGNNSCFTGDRVYTAVFASDSLESSIVNSVTGKQLNVVYYIDLQVLFVELIALTVFFIGACLIFKKG